MTLRIGGEIKVGNPLWKWSRDLQFEKRYFGLLLAIEPVPRRWTRIRDVQGIACRAWQLAANSDVH